MRLCRLTKTEPSLLLHPLDFLGADDATGLDFFPAMRIQSKQKLEIVGEVLRALSENFTVLNLREYARTTLAASPDLRSLKPDFSSPRISRMRATSVGTES
ncbi:MAG: hypothetical protein H7Y30_01050, partial [Pyrinomonadaceae bacterium]|nr:hypothetical protein [Pyrinomonadaceae bacterium]